MKVLVTGAQGMLGQDVCLALENSKHQFIAAGKSDLNITDLRECKSVVKDVSPDLIINCAAYTNVDGAEKQVKQAYDINDLGAKNLAIASNITCSKIIYISSDYVFDGKSAIAYTENDFPRPLSVYGKSKYWGEVSTKDYASKPYIIRTSWLYGDGGHNFVKTILNNDKEKLKIVNDQFGSPTSTKALANAIINFIDMKSQYGTYHFSCEGYCSWYVFAKTIVELSGANKQIFPCTSQEFKTEATRPEFSVMKSTKQIPAMPSWKEALVDYLS